MKYIENKKHFKEDVSNYDVRSSFTDDWFDKVQNNHIEIREYLKNIQRISEVKTDEAQSPLSNPEIKKIIVKFSNLGIDVEKCLYHNNLKIDVLKFPYCNKSSHANQRVTKILSKFIDTFVTIDKKDSYKILSDLGNLWNKNRNYELDCEVTLSTRAIDFLRLGKYEVDEDSCFCDERSCYFNKYSLGQTKNTFVLIFRKSKEIIARAWGFFNKENEIFNVSNFYFRKDIHEPTIISICKLFFADLMSVDYNDLFIYKGKVKVRSGIYHNKCGNYSFSIDDKIYIQDLMTDADPYSRPDICNHCENNADSKSIWGIKGLICSRCQRVYKKCQYSGLLDQCVEDAQDENGQIIKVSSSIINDDFLQCLECEIPCIIHSLENGLCKKCVKTLELQNA